MTNHFPGAKTRSLSSDSCCWFHLTDKFAAAPPQRVRTVVVHHHCCHHCRRIPSPVAPPPLLSLVAIVIVSRRQSRRRHCRHSSSLLLFSLRHRRCRCRCRCRRPSPSSYYNTNKTGGWQHQISQARAVHAHAPTYVPAVADHFCPIDRQWTPEEALAKNEMGLGRWLLMSYASCHLGVLNVDFSTRHRWTREAACRHKNKRRGRVVGR